MAMFALLSSRLQLKWILCAAALALAAGGVGGCASYAAPGRAADLSAFGVERNAQTDGSIVTALDKQPLATFPAAVAVARVQEPGYRSETTQSFGAGAYSVVTTRDIEKDEQFQRLAKLPLVAGLAPINRLLLPRELHTDLELRQAAAQLRADLLLIYTLDTTFRVEDKASPLTFVTLGLSPNQQAKVVTTASAVLMDTRNGYIYGIAEATNRDNQLASAWTSSSAVDDTRRRTETAAFDQLVDELERTWTSVIGAHAAARPAKAAAAPVDAAPRATPSPRNDPAPPNVYSTIPNVP